MQCIYILSGITFRMFALTMRKASLLRDIVVLFFKNQVLRLPFRLSLLLIYVFPFITNGQYTRGLRYEKGNIEDFPFVIAQYGAKQNLPQSQVQGMFKDKVSGKLILSTAYGLSSFDGKKISEFRKHPYYGRIIFMKLTQSDRIHDFIGFSSMRQLVVLSENPKILGRFAEVDISEGNWSTIDFDGDILWYDNKEDKVQKKVSTGYRNAELLKRLDSDNFLISGPAGTKIFNITTGVIKKVTSDKIKAAIFSDFHNAYVLTSNKAIYTFSPDLTFSKVFKCPGDCNFTNLEVAGDEIIFTSSSGLYLWHGNILQHYSQSSNFPSDELLSIFYDSTLQCMFVGTGNKGLIKLQPRRFYSMYGDNSGITGASGPMTPGIQGDFWFTNRTAVYQMKKGVPKRVFDNDKVNSSLLLMKDTIYASTRGSGIYYKSLINNEEGIINKTDCASVITLFKDTSGVVWAGIQNGVLTGNGMFDLKPFLPELISKPVSKIFEASNGMKFLGGYDGFYLLDKSNRFMASFGKESGFTRNGIRAFWEDNEGHIWIGTYGNGLFCYSNGKLTSLNSMKNCMIGNDVFSLARDQFGYILMTSNSGMRVVHETSLSDYINGRIDYLIPFEFGEEDGILNPEFNGGFQHNYATNDNRTFYFPSIQGLITYQAAHFPEAPRQLTLNKINVDNQILKKGEHIPRKTKYLTFVFDDIDLNPFENVHYQYRFVRGDISQSWSEIHTSREVTLNYPDPGSYRLDFRRLDGNNLVNPVMVSHSFYIEPYFYETGWFLLFAFFLLVLSIFIVIWIYLERRQRLLQEEIDTKSTITELQLSSIQSQMNPHFMFNAMSVLIHMINVAPKKKAEQFAISFARLMRQVLDQSKMTFISVQDEIYTLENYLYIQKQRLGSNFEYEIDCPVNLEKIQIPTMVIQPLVENAIIHGIANIQYPGKVSVKFSGSAPLWQVEISDNGIGINSARRSSDRGSKTSFGISLVQKKLELLKTKYGVHIDISFSELDSISGTGTRVTLKRQEV